MQIEISKIKEKLNDLEIKQSKMKIITNSGQVFKGLVIFSFDEKVKVMDDQLGVQYIPLNQIREVKEGR